MAGGFLAQLLLLPNQTTAEPEHPQIAPVSSSRTSSTRPRAYRYAGRLDLRIAISFHIYTGQLSKRFLCSSKCSSLAVSHIFDAAALAYDQIGHVY